MAQNFWKIQEFSYFFAKIIWKINKNWLNIPKSQKNGKKQKFWLTYLLAGGGGEITEILNWNWQPLFGMA